VRAIDTDDQQASRVRRRVTDDRHRAAGGVEHLGGELRAVLRIERGWPLRVTLIDPAPGHHGGDPLVMEGGTIHCPAQCGLGVRRFVDADDDVPSDGISINPQRHSALGPKYPISIAREEELDEAVENHDEDVGP
jgi:hypothetical protein